MKHEGRARTVLSKKITGTLRDYFAGQAAAGLSSWPAGCAPEAIAKQCYQIADALLRERAKGREPPK